MSLYFPYAAVERCKLLQRKCRTVVADTTDKTPTSLSSNDGLIVLNFSRTCTLPLVLSV